MDSNVEQFIDQLIDEKGYTTLDDEVRAQMKEDLANRLYDQIDRAMANALPEDKAIELGNKLDEGEMSDEELAKFMQDAGVDMQEVVLETMMKFRLLYTQPIADGDTPANDEANNEE